MFRRNFLAGYLAVGVAFSISVSNAAEWGSLHGNNGPTVHNEHHEGASPVVQDRSVIHQGNEHRNQELRRPEEHRQLAPVGREHGREFDAERRLQIERENRDRRHWDIDRDRHSSYFWFGYHPGMVVNVLPPQHTQLYVSGTPYYYDQGVYYESGPAGYVVVSPPVGALVPVLPPGAETIFIGGVPYYYAAGAFYVQQAQGYLVVAPPLGVTVTTLPPGANAVLINGIQYYQAAGAYFMPVMQGGVVVYTTVQPS